MNTNDYLRFEKLIANKFWKRKCEVNLASIIYFFFPEIDSEPLN